MVMPFSMPMAATKRIQRLFRHSTRCARKKGSERHMARCVTENGSMSRTTHQVDSQPCRRILKPALIAIFRPDKERIGPSVGDLSTGIGTSHQLEESQERLSRTMPLCRVYLL